MIGDGANDCQAIRAAHVGISFTNTDASFSSPFSSMDPSLKCIEYILLEGKCVLNICNEETIWYITISMIKFHFHMILLWNASMPAPSQVVYQSYVFGYIFQFLCLILSRPQKKLVPDSVPPSLVSRENLLI